MAGRENISQIGRLLSIMAKLRDPVSGCPWDLKQTFQTIVPSTLEECYELADAIELEQYDQVKEELGDVLFQVVFYSQLGKEEGLFDFDDIVAVLCEKLLRRHPHVFPGGSLEGKPAKDSQLTEVEVTHNWEAIKAEERAAKTLHGLLDDIPLALPALKRAYKIQKRVAGVGFDFPALENVFEKIKEELVELEQACVCANSEQISDELGDLLFSVINLARFLKVDPESSLRCCNRRFEKRFSYIENALSEMGMDPDSASMDIMDALWDEAKKA